ncbi:protein Aster-A-like isoform X1 [Parambassis ranga]|uniref:Protein Aster-A-like isoform X1 n=1 Tax=Parambassis ranga TaxID=210632 RepID=A0A6P7JVW2_9TELE|nr:protein Aster-A-like isoform X1 [Parambassis ranga]XP_028280851.1 protein Aster-A-like isoform X1 [Parambassis ranga]XP_028280852.1 protein Aster-A-like isoform X1 [Parambassis ranga]
MTMSSPVRSEGIAVAQPVPVPTLTVLPPSSDTESWSRSPSPKPPRSSRLGRSHRSRARSKRRNHEEHGCSPKPQRGQTPQIVVMDPPDRAALRRSPSPCVAAQMEGEQRGQDSPSHDLLLPPSRAGSRSPSPSRRSRWSLRSLLSRESDWDSCSTASNSPRSTPGSSPSLRRRVLGGGRASESEGGGEKSGGGGGGGGGSDSPLPSIPSASSLSSAYPIASRHFSRNAKKMQSWYNVLSPTYKQRNEDFRKIFKKLPDTERLIVDYSCALQKDILLQGRLYLSENWLCFYSNIFRWETTITILLKDVTSMTKEKTAKLIPNAIQISTDNEKHFFTSFGARDRSFMMIFRLWQNALLDKSLSPKELWHIVHQCYGTELGLTSEDDDYVSPTAEHMNGLLPGDESVSVTDLLDLSSVSVSSSGSSPPPLVPCSLASPPSTTSLSGSSPPSTASCLPIEVPSSSGRRLSSDPLDLSPPSSHGSLPSTTPTNASASAPASAAASFNLEEGGDSLSESANHMLPPPTTSLGNLSSLDITNDEELPTDPSNSSDTQEESEVESFCADLGGRLHINTAVRMSVDKLHDLLFSADTHFIQHLFSQRHFTDLSVGEWQQDGSSGTSSRVLSYTIALNNPLGPKTAPVVETQTLHKSSARGECFVVDSEVITSGIPYQDYFYTVHRYCLTSINKHKSRLRVSSDICYRKQPWSLVKALIEKNTWSGIEEYYKHMESEVSKLETLLQSEVTVVTTGEAVGADAAKTPPALRRRKRACSRRQGERERERDGGGMGGGDRGEDRGVREERDRREGHSQFLKLGERSRGGPNSISTILLIVSFILVVLVALNMLLFYKLYALERAAHTLETWHSYSVADSPLPQTAGEWAQVLQLQRQFHQAQLSKWQQILQSSVTLLDQMKQSLEKLHQGIVVPEVQQDPSADPHTESLTEA